MARMNPVLIGVIAAAILLLACLFWLAWRRSRRSTIRKSLAAIAIAQIDDVVVPDGMDGEIHIEHLLLTRNGVLVLNVAVAFAKLGYGALSNSLSMSADGLNSLLDGASNVVGLVGVQAAKGLAWGSGKPLVAVDHLVGHLSSA